VMSIAKWFAVRKPSTGEIIATSANQMVPPKFRLTYKTVVLYSPDPPFLLQCRRGVCSVEGGSGNETSTVHDVSIS